MCECLKLRHFLPSWQVVPDHVPQVTCVYQRAVGPLRTMHPGTARASPIRTLHEYECMPLRSSLLHTSLFKISISMRSGCPTDFPPACPSTRYVSSLHIWTFWIAVTCAMIVADGSSSGGSAIDATDPQSIVDMHNSLRSRCSAPPLYWDSSLASSAQVPRPPPSEHQFLPSVVHNTIHPLPRNSLCVQ